MIVFDQFQIKPLNTENPGKLFHLLNNNRERLENDFPVTIGNAKTFEKLEDYCIQIQEKVKNKTYLPYIIYSNHEWIGFLDVKRIDWSFPKGEIGYFMDEKFEGQGLMTKAIKVWTEYLVDKYQFIKLVARIDIANVGSSKVVLKNGFQLEGTLRKDHRTLEGKLIDVSYYGKLYE